MSKRLQLVLISALLCAAAMWCYVDRVLIPFQRAQAAARDVPRGNLSDLYPRWLGARELLLNGRDPYSPDITREIQQGYYGRELDPNRPADPKDQQGFAYPLYVVFLLAPTVRLSFPVVQTGFRWLLIGCITFSVPFWLRALGEKAWRPAMLAWIIFTLGCFPAVQGLKLQQLTLLVCLLLAWAFAALASGRFVVAGVLLAVATIKPQLVAIACAWLLLWCLADWRVRGRVFRGFATTLLLLVLASNFILPGWISRFRSAAREYLRYTGGGKSLLDVLLKPSGGKIVAVLVLLALGGIAWRFRHAVAGSGEFAVVMATVMSGTLVVIPTYAPYNQLLLLPAVMLLVAEGDWFWNGGRGLRMMAILTAAVIAWPWLTAAMLDIALLIYPSARVQGDWWIPLFTSLVIPVAVLGMCGVLAVASARNRPTPARP